LYIKENITNKNKTGGIIMRKSEPRLNTNTLVVTQHKTNENGEVTSVNGNIITSNGYTHQAYFDTENGIVNVDRMGEKSIETLGEFKPLAKMLANLEVETQATGSFVPINEIASEQQIINAVGKFTDAAQEAIEKSASTHDAALNTAAQRGGR
jgi:hypothetical protein